MEVIRWVSFWEEYKNEFEQENTMPGGGLGERAAEDLRQRVIEHVRLSLSFSQNITAAPTLPRPP